MEVHNKLVRDNIPQIIMGNGNIPNTRILDDQAYRQELLKKLVEEANEVLGAYKSADFVKEISDVLEVIDYLVPALGLEMSEILAVKAQRKLERGGFSEKIFLESVL